MENISSITYLRFNIGGFDATKFEVILNRKTVTYFADMYRYDEGVKHKKKISSDDLESLVANLNKIQLIEWNDRYDSDVLDGIQWELKITYNDRVRKSIYGSNCYPYSKPNSTERSDEFNKLMEALSLLIQEPNFFSDSFLTEH